MSDPWCCYIPDEHQEKVRAIAGAHPSSTAESHAAVGARACPAGAEWLIVFGSGSSPDGYTHSCTTHVGELLDDQRPNTVSRLL